MRGTMGNLLASIIVSVTAALAWWRASQGLTGWTEISAVMTIGAVILWVFYLRARRT